MKIIDLFNLMVIGKEDLPKRIRYEDEIYYLTDNHETYIGTISHSAIGRRHCLEQCLTDEVEILEEEKKIPEKLDLILDEQFTNDELQAYIYETQEKVNQVIDYLKSKGEE